jgi:molybdenum cofactor cytidylyltransferase
MGTTKALVHIDGEPLVARLARVFVEAGLTPVVITVPPGSEGEAVTRALAGLPVMTCANAYDDEGLFGSVRTAMTNASDDDTLVITPVDAPFASAALVRTLVNAIDDTHDAAAPVIARMRGHPVAIRARALRAQLEIGRTHGLTRVIKRLGDRVADVAWDDARVLVNVNTPAELTRAMAGATTSRP